jgi:hypothetical protein
MAAATNRPGSPVILLTLFVKDVIGLQIELPDLNWKLISRVIVNTDQLTKKELPNPSFWNAVRPDQQ